MATTILTQHTLGVPFSGTIHNSNLQLIEDSLGAIGPYIVSGLVPSAGVGLVAAVTAGEAFIGGSVTVSSFNITGLTDNTLNHLYLLNTGAGTSNTSGTQPANSVKLGTATTAAGSVTSVDTSYASGRQEQGSSNFSFADGITQIYATNTGNSPSSLKGLHINKTDDTSGTSHGISFDVEGNVVAEIGVDVSTVGGDGEFVLYYDPSVLQNEIQIVTVGTNNAGQYKLTFSAQQTADIAFNAAAATVQSALEALSNIAPGDVIVTGNTGGPWRVEFAATYAATNVSLMTLANGTTPLSGGSGQGVSVGVSGTTGADVIRCAPYVLATGISSAKVQIGNPAGPAFAQTEMVQIVAPEGLSGLTVSVDDATGVVNSFGLINRSVISHRAILNIQNHWQVGCDYQNTGATHFSIVDSDVVGGAKTRLFIAGNGLLTNLAGVNTDNPLSSWHVGISNDATLYDVEQTTFSSGYSTLTNRSVNIQQILDASQTTNFIWLMGTLDSASTRVTPTASSIGPTCHGIESTNTVLSIISAPSGTNQTINRVIQVGDNTLSYFDGTPAAKQTVTGAKGGNAALASLLTALAAYGLVTDSSTA